MTWLLDAFYFLALLALSPWLIYKALTTGKYRRGLGAKLLGGGVRIARTGPRVWFHGVSVGEIHLLRQVVTAFRRRHPDWVCAVSTTTDTGFDEARRCFPDLAVFFFPLDFSWAVRRTMRSVRPDLVVLAEGEIWPNFLVEARRQAIPVSVINGRMSPTSSRRYRRLVPLARWLFGHLELLAVQTEDHAAALRDLRVDPSRVHVTGSVKFDGVLLDRHNPRTEEMRHLYHVGDKDLVWVAGSTQDPEEEVVLDLFASLRQTHPNLRLFLVPRQKDRFAPVAELVRTRALPWVRRSALDRPLQDRVDVVLVDTFGELGALWGLADVAFVGGSLDGQRGGQNMIEPAAFGAAVVFGPHVWNFRETAAQLVQAGAACQVADPVELASVVERLLTSPEERRRRGEAARDLVLRQQGAAERTVRLLDDLLSGRREQTLPTRRAG